MTDTQLALLGDHAAQERLSAESCLTAHFAEEQRRKTKIGYIATTAE